MTARRDLLLYVRLPTASGGMQVARPRGYRTVRRRRDGVAQEFAEFAVWVARRRCWARTLQRVEPSDVAYLESATVADLVRVGLIQWPR